MMLHERLRKHVADSQVKGAYPIMLAFDGEHIIRDNSVSMDEWERQLFELWADEIEEHYLPRPHDENGELIQPDMLVDGLDYEVVGYDVASDGRWTLYDAVSEVSGYGCVFLPTDEDTQEKIDKDARKHVIDYWGCSDVDCNHCTVLLDGKKPYERYDCSNCQRAMNLDLLRRQRELDRKSFESKED